MFYAIEKATNESIAIFAVKSNNMIGKEGEDANTVFMVWNKKCECWQWVHARDFIIVPPKQKRRCFKKWVSKFIRMDNYNTPYDC